MANAKFRKLFEKNPKKFVAQDPPSPRHKSVLVWGPPLSGRTAYAKQIAVKMNVPYLDVEELLIRHLQENTEVGLVVSTRCFLSFNFLIVYLSQARKKLLEGLAVPPDVYAQLILYETSKKLVCDAFYYYYYCAIARSFLLLMIILLNLVERATFFFTLLTVYPLIERGTRMVWIAYWMGIRWISCFC